MTASSAVVTGSQAMQQTLLSCQSLCTMLLGQIVQEDRIDPFPLKTTLELEELVEACRRTKEILTRETLIYSRTADFSMYNDQELIAMTAFVRETARMLSVVLAGGREHFFNGQGVSIVNELQKMEIFIDGKVKEYLLIEKLIETLEIKQKYGRKPQLKGKLGSSQRMQLADTLDSNLADIVDEGEVTVPCAEYTLAQWKDNHSPREEFFKNSKDKGSPKKSSPILNHPDVSIFASVDVAKGATSPESLQKLAEICEQFAGQCREVSRIRYEKVQDRTRKVDARERLQIQVEELMPYLRQHVLRIGLCKTTSNGRHENLGTVVDYSRVMTQLFTHQAVTEAHKAVEDCRERLLQEALYRKQKAEKRMEREIAREEAYAAARERVEKSPGRSPSQAGYLGPKKSIAEGWQSSGDTTARKSLSRNLSMVKRASQSPPRAQSAWTHRSEIEHLQSHTPEKEKKEKKEKKSKRKEDDSPDSGRSSKKKEGKEKKDKGKSRSESPRGDGSHKKK